MSINGLNNNLINLLNNSVGKSLLQKMDATSSDKPEDLTSQKLAELLKNPPQKMSVEEQRIYEELKKIDEELSSMENEFNNLREEDRLDIVKAKMMLDRLKEIEVKLSELEETINKIIEDRKARDEMNRLIYNQFNQIDLLRVQAEKYREMNKNQENNQTTFA
jgi:predicted transcriptional regulator